MPNVINATSTGNGGLITQGDDSGILNIQTNETTAITVDTSQNVGIGTTSPNIGGANTSNAILSLIGKASTRNGILEMGNLATTGNDQTLGWTRYFDGSTENAAIEVARASSTSTAYMKFSTNGGSGDTERMRIDSSGNLLVGTTSTPSSATGSVVANNASYIGSNKVVNWTKTNSSNNVTTATVVFQTTSSWFTNYIKFTVSCVQANSANNFAASYLYQIATLDASGGTTRQVLAQGDNAQFTVTVTGNSGTGTQTWTVSVTGPATANRMILTLEAGSALGINATA